MKLSVIFLALLYCMVATSYGQNFFYWPFSHRNQPLWTVGSENNIAGRLVPYAPRHYYNNFQPVSSLQEENYEGDADEDEALARNKYYLGGVSKNNKHQQIRNQMGKQIIGGRNTVTTYTTVYATTVTATQASIVNCLTTNYFVGKKDPGKTCGQARKRQALEMLDINASAVNTGMMATALADDAGDDVYRNRRDNIDSSFEMGEFYPYERIPNEVNPRFGFQVLSSLLFSVPVKTVTISLGTSYSFAATAYTSKITLDDPNAGPINQLFTCVPAGFVVCS